MVTKNGINRSSQSVVAQIKGKKWFTQQDHKGAKKFLAGSLRPNFPSCIEYIFVAFAALL
jgi:hypothetical protein